MIMIVDKNIGAELRSITDSYAHSAVELAARIQENAFAEAQHALFLNIENTMSPSAKPFPEIKGAFP